MMLRLCCNSCPALVLRPLAAVGVAAILSEKVKGQLGLRRISVMLCAGRGDIDKLLWTGSGSA